MKNTMRLQTNLGRADMLNAYATYYDDPGHLQPDLERYRTVTPARVQAAAQRCLGANRVVLSVVPRGQTQPLNGTRRLHDEGHDTSRVRGVARFRSDLGACASSGPVAGGVLSHTSLTFASPGDGGGEIGLGRKRISRFAATVMSSSAVRSADPLHDASRAFRTSTERHLWWLLRIAVAMRKEARVGRPGMWVRSPGLRSRST